MSGAEHPCHQGWNGKLSSLSFADDSGRSYEEITRHKIEGASTIRATHKVLVICVFQSKKVSVIALFLSVSHEVIADQIVMGYGQKTMHRKYVSDSLFSINPPFSDRT